jgi:hypothetical protein
MKTCLCSSFSRREGQVPTSQLLAAARAVWAGKGASAGRFCQCACSEALQFRGEVAVVQRQAFAQGIWPIVAHVSTRENGENWLKRAFERDKQSVVVVRASARVWEKQQPCFGERRGGMLFFVTQSYN